MNSLIQESFIKSLLCFLGSGDMAEHKALGGKALFSQGLHILVVVGRW